MVNPARDRSPFLGASWRLSVTLDQKHHLQRKAFAIATDLGLTADERRELAHMLPGTEQNTSGRRSWVTLDQDDLAHLVTWLDGARLVRDLLSMRP